jgi:S-adenosylmethionine uptake transporter
MINGIAVGFLAYGLFSTADACIKALGGSLSVFEIIFFITVGHFLTIGVAKPAGENWRHIFRMNRPGLVGIRAVCAVGAGLCGVYAFTTLPLAEAYALIFLMPAFTTLLSIPLLGEEVGWRRWTAVAIGFAGVLLVIKPGFRELHLGHLAAAVTAGFAAASMIVLRILGPTEKRITLLAAVYTAAVSVNGVLMIPTFVMPSAADFGIIAIAGIAGGFGQICMIIATKLAPANRVAPAQYSQIVWAVVFGAVFFGEIPDALSFAGMALVTVSGLITFVREEKLYGWSRRIVLMRNRPDEF